jgi:hypothetical protein
MEIPQELVALASERRLIPFVGAGFSSALDLPSWETMLRALCDRVEGSLPFDELSKSTSGDYLQIAEYLFLKCDRQIGPIRHQLEKSLSNHTDPLLSGPHVELVNLGAAQIYTTNYDDLIESTYRALGLDFSTVVLPKDVALAHTDRTQIVKYHGDLAHESTLVLTESAYYKRLDFESPMDLKFRSDLLGKSVLFMGYSFRDVNIRIIWFKLMQMMRDIPEADRRPSYIVRLDPDPALDELNAAVGLRTIVLNPDGPVDDPAERIRLLGDFLLRLSTAASPKGTIPGAGNTRSIVSSAVIHAAERQLASVEEHFPKGMGFRYRGIMSPSDTPVRQLLGGTVPEPLLPTWQATLQKLVPYLRPGDGDIGTILDKVETSPSLTSYVIQLLASQGDPRVRTLKKEVLKNASLWPRVWASPVSSSDVDMILRQLDEEIGFQAASGADEDIVYLAELATRVASGQLGDEVTEEQMETAKMLLGRATKLYPAVAELSPTRDTPPDIKKLMAEVRKREEDFEPVRMRDLMDGDRPEPLAPSRGSARSRTS